MDRQSTFGMWMIHEYFHLMAKQTSHITQSIKIRRWMHLPQAKQIHFCIISQISEVFLIHSHQRPFQYIWLFGLPSNSNHCWYNKSHTWLNHKYVDWCTYHNHHRYISQWKWARLVSKKVMHVVSGSVLKSFSIITSRAQLTHYRWSLNNMIYCTTLGRYSRAICYTSTV